MDKHRKVFLERTEACMKAQFRGAIREAQGHYDYLLGYSESANIEFAQAFEAARARLLQGACGILDSEAYLGGRLDT